MVGGTQGGFVSLFLSVKKLTDQKRKTVVFWGRGMAAKKCTATRKSREVQTMRTPNRTARKSAAITRAANKAGAIAGKTITTPGNAIDRTEFDRIKKQTMGRSAGNKGKGPAYPVPKPVKPRAVKK